MAKTQPICEVRVTLKGSKPPIWRKLAVPADFVLADLHEVIQIAMGWTNSHMHQFILRGKKPKPARRKLPKATGTVEKTVIDLPGGRKGYLLTTKSVEGGDACEPVKPDMSWFDTGDRYYVTKVTPWGDPADMKGEDEEAFTLGEVCPKVKSKLIYEYDAYGRKWKMHTYRSGDDANKWSGSSWPAEEPASDATEWVYHGPTGLLLQKKDANNQGPTYTYTPEGRMLTRTWARGATATYAYDSATGERLSVTYTNDDDLTPDVAFTYDRLGRLRTVTDAVGTRTFWYRPSDLRLDTERIVGNANGYSRDLMRYYQTAPGVPGRKSGFSTGYYTIGYHYDSTGWMHKITGTGLPAGGVVYERVRDASQQVVSDRVGARRYMHDDQTPAVTSTWSYEPDRDLLTSVENRVDAWESELMGMGAGGGTSLAGSGSRADRRAGLTRRYADSALALALAGREAGGSALLCEGDLSLLSEEPTLLSRFSHTYDDVGRRDTQDIASMGATYLSRYGYNGRGELTDDDWHDDWDSEVPFDAYDYRYDPIGNRTSALTSSEWLEDFTYQANSLNQYETINGGDEELTYDLDGNLVGHEVTSGPAPWVDPSYAFVWDAENRLVEIRPLSVPPSPYVRKLRFAYDYMNRRVRKQVIGWDAVAGAWKDSAPEQDLRFVYDGWNVTEVIDGLSPGLDALRYYAWGKDLSGLAGAAGPEGVHGAGGIGGLLAVKEVGGTYAGDTYYYLYNTRGDVTEMLNADYEYVGDYAYDAYGNWIIIDGDYPFENPFRFSTKWEDAPVAPWMICQGWYNFGRRYLGPRWGRWTSKDPIEEEGGLNLYAHVANSPIDTVDPLGLQGLSTPACSFACGQCANQCVAAGASRGVCQGLRFNCHRMCITAGRPTKRCGGGAWKPQCLAPGSLASTSISVGGALGSAGGTYMIIAGAGKNLKLMKAGCCITVVSLAAVLADISTLWSTASGIVSPIDILQDYYECLNAGLPAEVCDQMRRGESPWGE